MPLPMPSRLLMPSRLVMPFRLPMPLRRKVRPEAAPPVPDAAFHTAPRASIAKKMDARSYLANYLCGSRLQPRHQNGGKNRGFSS